MHFSLRFGSRSLLSLSLLAALSMIGLAACDLLGLKDDGDDVINRYAENVVAVSSDISANASWIATKVYYLDSPISVQNGATLTIAAGTVVKFGTEGQLMIENGATIKAIGTDLARIVFTSIRDDSVGGDSILDDGSTPAGAGDWNYIWTVNGSTGNEFRHCVFRYAGKGKDAALYLEGAAIVDSCRFHDNLGGLPFVGGEHAALDARRAAAGTTITNNLFYGNIWPLAVPASMSLDASNSFSFDHDADPDTLALGNTHQAIYLQSETIGAATSWTETEVPLCLFARTDFLETATLTLASGVVCKFSSSTAGLEFADGASYSIAGAIFSSFRDDTLLGDSNGDAAASTPTNGDWEGIYDHNIPDYLTRDNFGAIRYSQNTAGD